MPPGTRGDYFPIQVSCFLTYLAVSTDDPLIRSRITYARLIMREAMWQGGLGWLHYDQLFRQQATLNRSLQWDVIYPQLQATTILAQHQTGRTGFCTLCQESDHESQQCVLLPLQNLTLRQNSSSQCMTGCFFGRICNSWNDEACIYPEAVELPTRLLPLFSG